MTKYLSKQHFYTTILFAGGCFEISSIYVHCRLLLNVTFQSICI